ncbi:MAG: DNA-processing protein DprA [Candidatus Peregrinibacteria bacterium]
MDEYLYLWAQWGAAETAEQYRQLKETFGDLERAWKEITPAFFTPYNYGAEKLQRLFEIRRCLDFQQITQDLARFKTTLFCIDEPSYPECLKNIPDAPPFLFVRGQLPPLHKAFAVVGTRKMSAYGRHATEVLVADLVRNGFVIVSGLANGVDDCAHVTTLEYHGTTVAVLGCGVDLIYPASNERLGEQILRQGGAIVSEFPLGTPAMKYHFPRRNRIISGLSRGVLVIEGGMKSGAKITAEKAVEQGRNVFAVPAPLSGELSCANYLIQQGAALVQSAQDILGHYQMQGLDFHQTVELTPEEQEIMNHISQGGKTMDELVVSTPYSIPQLSEILLVLCLKKQLREMGNKWVLI